MLKWARGRRKACPDIPRWDETKVQAKCDMCLDRVQNGLLPACVLSCPTGTMHFGDREDMLELAGKRLAEVRAYRPNAVLVDPEDTRVVFLCEESPASTMATPWPMRTFPGR